ncbi:GAF and ANTAR domain-containing protein [Actinoplanes sp. CA-252034]|uniref:GAF and ANTAR domain-containing protein n=1 Tax=Actinoplanes sp. CA-252034 TaxID=3239906 RepID=UPI003D975298
MIETHLADVFVELSDTLVDDFYVVDFLHSLTERCVKFLDVSAAGLLLAEGQGALQLVAASSERTRLLGLFQLQADQGPCLDCYHTGTPVSVPDLPHDGRWPRFTAAAAGVGFAAVHALPMRHGTNIIGALSLFDTTPGVLAPDKVRIGQAMADVATIGLLQQRAIHDSSVLTQQLQNALNSRILIEQAKGVLAERLQISMEDAFTTMRNAARNHNQRLATLAETIISGSDVATSPFLAPPHETPAPPL